MGKRGPKPAPTNLRLLRGETHLDRINDDEPVPAEGSPACPPEVTDPTVREVWTYTVHQLEVMGIASPADRDALLCYCEAVAIHRKASAFLATDGLFTASAAHGSESMAIDNDGQVVMRVAMVRHPALQTQRDAAALIARFAQLFGLSPSSRSEIRTGAAKSSDKGADRFLTG